MRVYRVVIRPLVTYGAETMILTQGEEEKLKRIERKIARKIYGPKKVPKTDELRGPGKITSRGHCENYKTTEVAMVRTHRRIGEEEVMKKVTECKQDFR